MSRAPRSRGGRARSFAALSLVLGVATVLFTAPSRRATQETAEPGGAPAMAAVRDGFEPRDVVTRSVALAMVIGVSAIALSIAGLFALLGYLHRQDAASPPLTPQQTAVIVAPGPPLQSDPIGDLAALHRREDAVLTTYRWLSPDRTAAAIPIDRAMALVVGKPLDPAPSVAAAPEAGAAP